MAKRGKQQPKTIAPEQVSPPPESRSSRWFEFVSGWRLWRVAAGIIVFLLATVLLAPTIVGKTPLLNRLIGRSVGEFKGHIRVGSASLNWFSPIRLQDIQLTDVDGGPLGSVEAVSTSRTLLGLLLDQSNLGKFSVQRPNLEIVLSATGSNWETACAELLSASESSGHSAVEFEMIDGRIGVLDQITKRKSEISAVKIQGKFPATPAGPTTIELEAAQSQGVMASSFSLTRSDSAGRISSADIRVTTRDFALAVFEPFLSRFMPDFDSIRGAVTTQINAKWNSATENTFSIDGQLNVTDLAAGSKWLNGQEQLRLASASLKLQMHGAGEQIDIKKLSLNSSLGNVDISGSAPLRANLLDKPVELLFGFVDAGGMSVSGNLNLAALANAVPQSLRLRADTQIESGELQFRLLAEPLGGTRSLTGDVRIAELIATRNGIPIRFKQPVQLEFGVIEKNGELKVEKCVGQSTFLSFSARGGTSSGQIAGQADLRRFQAQMQQFVDLNGCEFDGRVRGQVQWQRTGDNLVDADASATGEQLRVVMNGRSLLNEPRLDSTAHAVARLERTHVAEILDANVDLRSGTERLLVKLSKPVALPLATAELSADVELDGNLAALQSRTAAVVALPDASLDGQVSLRSPILLTATAINLPDAQIELTDFRLKTARNEFAEKVVKIQTDFSIDRQSLGITTRATVVTSSFLALRAQDMRIELNDARPRLAGALHCRGDMGRISRLLGLDQTGTVVTGEFTSKIDLKQTESTVSFDATSDCRNVRVLSLTVKNDSRAAGQWQPIWHEPRIDLRANGQVDLSAGSLSLEPLDVKAESAHVAAKGSLGRANDQLVCDIQGTAEYDLDKLSDRFRDDLGEQIRVSGRVNRPFMIKGPISGTPASRSSFRNVSRSANTTAGATSLVSSELIAQTGIGWKNASIYGILIGENSINARLEQQQVVIEPFQVAVDAGRMSLSPRIDLRGRTPVLELAKGRVLDNIRLSPELCKTWMKFVAPLLAEATEAEGNFSLEMEAAAIPLTTPARARLLGRLDIHEARVRPGPLAKEFLSVAQQIKTLTTKGGQASRIFDAERSVASLPKQQVEFQMRDGQVGHRGLVMEIGDVEVRTEGWVSMDERLSLTAHIPIQDEWLGDERLLAGLRGQSLAIPVTGTLQRPKLDSSSLGKLTKQAVVGAAEGLLRQELGKQLDRLFRAK